MASILDGSGVDCLVKTDWDWWKHTTFYHIYVKSFKDSNNDGIGDLQGIIQKLDHFCDAGVEAIWLSPIFQSPKMDQGYDISNYMDIDPDYGTIDDLKQLIDEAHEKGVKLLLDFVPNHTSDQHQWFKDSVNGVDQYRDFYIWAEPRIDAEGNKLPPNNWISVFNHCAWTWNDKRQQYYFHQFDPSQPDLNFHNPKVVEEMDKVLLFWLDYGVDGFRVDAIPYLVEHKDLPDEPLSHLPGHKPTDYEYLDHIYSKDQPESYQMMHHWRTLLDDYTRKHGGTARILMTEAYTTVANTMLYFGTPDGTKLGAHFTFNFFLVGDANSTASAQDIVDSINKWLDNIPEIYTSNWVLSNHDNHRVATRCGPGNVDGFNMLIAILPGIDITYYGEEIGQENGEVSYEENQDLKVKHFGMFWEFCRDFERTPFQWDDTVNAGFNDGGKTWLPVSTKYKENNLKNQKESEGLSHYKVYRELRKIRKDPVLSFGGCRVRAIGRDVIVVRRKYRESSIVLVFNKGSQGCVVNVSEDVEVPNSVKLTSTDSSRTLGSAIDPANLVLQAHEALVLSCWKVHIPVCSTE